MKRNLFRIVSSLTMSVAMLSFFQGCGKISQEEDEPVIMMDYPREDIVLTKAQAEYLNAGNQFAFKWLSIVNGEQEGDWFVSPLSMQYILGMFANGATEMLVSEISLALGYKDAGTEEMNDFLLYLSNQLKSLDPNTHIYTANLALSDKNNPFKTAYKERVNSFYGAFVQDVTFSKPATVVDIVNNWASDNTKGALKEVVSKDDIPTETIFILGNVVYFKGEWINRFIKSNTKESVFYKRKGKIKVPMMQQQGTFFGYQTEVFKQITLPYGNGAYQMDVFLPLESKGIEDVILFLSQNGISKGIPYIVDVWLPRFETETPKRNIYSHLQSLGISSLGLPYLEPMIYTFDNGNSINGSMFSVYHTAKIKVDESGSEAAAATIAGASTGANLETPAAMEFHADHPFLYLIREVSTGAILFAGKYGAE